ncbi:hypothetical protein LCGC14_1149580 [marine sediment metagenome]|uniref:VWFA domain-containing protein n=1 Tax=marine sediment metagenome TaxID=412755 RepID=A0A0F9LVZ7_9ZZZZ|nr:hypothetical protein [Pricia sp.]
MTVNTEQQTPVHEEMFKTLLRTPHRKVDEIISIHKEQFERDPNFYGKLAVYAIVDGNCVIRDVNEVFISTLLVSPYPEHQDAGYVMFQSLPPYQVARVAQFVTGYDERVRRHSFDPPMPRQGEHEVTYERARYGKNHAKAGEEIPRQTVALGTKTRKELINSGKIDYNTKEIYVDTYMVHHKCHNHRNFKGALRRAARSYLRYREANPNLMTGALIRAAKFIRPLYVRCNLLPQNDENGWINRYLWKNEVVPGTRLAAVKELQQETDPIKQAEIIMDNKLPSTLVASVVKNMTPSVWVATISVMSPQEMMQSLGMMKKHGIFENSDLKKLVNDKLKKTKKADKSRVDALKGAKVAKSVKGLDEETVKLVVEVTDAQLKQHGQISVPTALLIDKSGSMHNAIALGKELGAAIAQACVEGNPPLTYLFDNVPTQLTWTESDGDITTKSAWDKKLAMFRASGGTTPSAVLRAMQSSNTIVVQFVIVTDEGENVEGQFAVQLQRYCEQFNVDPSVVIIRVGGGWGSSDRMEKTMKKKGFNVEVMPCQTIDQIAIPNLIGLLSRQSVFELIQEILALKLPSKEKWDKTHLSKEIKKGRVNA